MAYVLILVAVFSAGAGLGGWGAYEISQAKIVRLQSGIDKGNAEAAERLNRATADAAANRIQAIQANQEIDHAQTAFVETVNAYDERLDSVQLFDNTHSQSCPDALPARHTTVVSANTARYAEYAANTNRALAAAARECDIAAEYAMNAYTFANSGKGCGIR